MILSIFALGYNLLLGGTGLLSLGHGAFYAAGAYGLGLFSLHVTPHPLAEPVLVSLIGGIQTFSGPLVGSAIYIILREIIERFTQNWMLWFAIILLLIIMGFRGGVVGGLSRISDKLFLNQETVDGLYKKKGN